MSLIVPCECGNELLVKKDLLGQRIKCPDCVRTFIVPVISHEVAAAPAATVIETPVAELAERFRPDPASEQAALDFWATRRAAGGEIIVLAHDKLYEATAYLKEFTRTVESLRAGGPADQALTKPKNVIRFDLVCGIEANLHDRWLNVSWKNTAAKDATETLVCCPDRESRDEIVQALQERFGSTWTRKIRQDTRLEAISAPLAVVVVCGLLTVGLAITANWLEGIDISTRGGGRLGWIFRLIGMALKFIGPVGVTMLGAPLVLLGAVWLLMCFRKPPRMLTLTASPADATKPKSPEVVKKNVIQSSDIFLTDEPGKPVKKADSKGGEWIRKEYRRRVHRQVVVPVIGLLLIGATFVIGGPDWAKGATVVVLIPLFGFTFWNWRCPACNGYLGKGSNHRFCPKCSVQLKD